MSTKRKASPPAENHSTAASDTDRRLLELTVLAEIGQLMTAALDVNDVYERFARLAGKMLQFDRIAVASIDVEAQTMTTTYEAGVHVPAWGPGQTRALFRPLAGMIMEAPGAMLVDEELARWVVTEYPEMQDILDAGLLSTLAVPIFNEDRHIAFLALNSKDPRAYTAEDGELAERIVAQVAGVIANAELRAELQHEVEQRTTLAEIGRLVASSVELDEMYGTLAGLIRGLLPYERFTALRADAETDLVTTDYVVGVEVPGRAVGDITPIGETILARVIQERAGVRFTADNEEDRATYPIFSDSENGGLRTVMMAPLVSQGRIIGGIALGSRQGSAYSQAAVELLERIAAQVGGAIGAAQLRAQLQAESDERVEQLQQIDALRLQFLQMVSHEFRTPLASLRISRDLLAETPLSDLNGDSYDRLISNMGRGVDRLDSLVTDLLDLTIAQAGELNLNIAHADLRDLLADAVEIVSPLASQWNQEFNIQIETPSPLVRVDRQRIEQVLLNLLSNAHKYSDEGAVIDVTVKKINGSAEVRVTGKGPDIPEQDRPHMFEPFFRGSATQSRTIPGRGLGLSIARAFVELHGGQIGFDSIPETGPSFYFTLPLSDSSPERIGNN
jgi:signal transduction histidine kinase